MSVRTRLSKMKIWSKVLRRPSHWPVLAGQNGQAPVQPETDADHLQGTIDWLCTAQDAGEGGGVAMGYDMAAGWLPPYPETTGYIIPTFLDHARRTGRDEYVTRAIAMGEWERTLQLENGAIPGPDEVGRKPMIFDTGQVILGWMALHELTGRGEWLDAAVRAGRWLASVQDADGKWSRHAFNDVPHVYYSRVAWGMFKAAAMGDDVIGRSALKFVEWVMSCARPNGGFEHMGFRPDRAPLTHTIAYTLDGLQECVPYLPGELAKQVTAAVAKTSAAILELYNARRSAARPLERFLPGQLNPDWSPAADYSCLTGNAQMAIIWMRQSAAGAGEAYAEAAHRLLEQVKATQIARSANRGVQWGVVGSCPVWGGYATFMYPNWAAKFLADALMLRMDGARPAKGS